MRVEKSERETSTKEETERNVEILPSSPAVCLDPKLVELYTDTAFDPTKKQKLNSLKRWMKDVLATNQVHRYDQCAFESDLEKDATWTRQLRQWRRQAASILSESLAATSITRQHWDSDSCGLRVPGRETSEMLHHCKWAQHKCRSFKGREELVKEAISRININDCVNAGSSFSRSESSIIAGNIFAVSTIDSFILKVSQITQHLQVTLCEASPWP